MRTRYLTLTAAALALVTHLACQPQAELEPMTESELVESEAEVVQEVAGVRAVVDSDAWQGDPEVNELVTPIKLEISNGSDQPLRIRFPNFALLGAHDRYSVLPVFGFENVEGTVMLIEGYAPVAVPEFSHEEYYVTDYYSAAYPGFTTYEHALVLDEPYYSRYTVAWDDLPLPTEEMQRWALPEGVLPPGSSLSGFLFFEGLHPGEAQVNFLAQFENAETGDYFGAVTVPMEAENRLEP